MELKVFVIIVAYKGIQWYDRCLSSLRQSTVPLKTIVVENASRDGTVEYIKSNYPEIRLIESKTNLGFGKANNLAMRYALDQRCDYVFLLNQDAWVEPNTIEDLISIHKCHPEYGILSPMHLNADKNKIEKGLVNYIDDKTITDKNFFEDLFFDRVQEVYSTSYVNAAAWLIPYKTLNVIGGFDPLFLHYGEDDNYLHRVRFHKMDIGICPGCIVVHDTERRISKQERIAMTENKNLLVDLLNVNTPVKLLKLCFFHLRKAIIKVIAFKFASAQMHWRDLRFIILNWEAIQFSRTQNVKEQPNWL